MSIQLFVEPGKTYSWKEFCIHKPPFSIALDGFVSARTMREEEGPRANFDHHFGADRLSTRSTSDQIHLEINQGLFETFRKNGIPTANIFVNDPDEDVCLAVWLLFNHEKVDNHAQANINRLVYCEDRLDTTAGSYPFGETSIRRRMAWIFEPYNRARFEGKLESLDSSLMKAVIESVGARINRHVFGDGGEELALEGMYERIGGGKNWVFVRETGPASRMALFNDGVKAFGALVSEKDGFYRYVFGRKSVWIPIPLYLAIERLNSLEPEGLITDQNKWGGSNTIIGSPRLTGSKLSPSIIIEEFNLLEKNNYGSSA